MTGETKIAILAGLGMIVGFGVVLQEIKDTSSPTGRSGPPAGRFTSYSLAPAVDRTLSERSPTPRPPRPGPTRSELASHDGSVRDARRPAAAAQTYEVQSNDSLAKIARKIYGQGGADFYRIIYEANRDVLTDEKTIRVGQVLVIPPLDSRQAGEAVRASRHMQPRGNSVAALNRSGG